MNGGGTPADWGPSKFFSGTQPLGRLAVDVKIP